MDLLRKITVVEVTTFVLLLVVLGLVSGCVTTSSPPPSTRIVPVCTALIGPIQYNSQNPKSRRHAGPDLAPDLKRRNQVGQNLRCPAYR